MGQLWWLSDSLRNTQFWTVLDLFGHQKLIASFGHRLPTLAARAQPHVAYSTCFKRVELRLLLFRPHFLAHAQLCWRSPNPAGGAQNAQKMVILPSRSIHLEVENHMCTNVTKAAFGAHIAVCREAALVKTARSLVARSSCQRPPQLTTKRDQTWLGARFSYFFSSGISSPALQESSWRIKVPLTRLLPHGFKSQQTSVCLHRLRRLVSVWFACVFLRYPRFVEFGNTSAHSFRCVNVGSVRCGLQSACCVRALPVGFPYALFHTELRALQLPRKDCWQSC